MTKREKLKYCHGCRDNFYNGNNPHGVKECWNLESAKLVMKKEVHGDQRPPWTQKASKFLSCYHADGYFYFKPDTVR